MSMPENIENIEELVNTIKGQIADKEKEIQENFTKLGEVYYVKYAKDPDGDFSELCQEIENQYQEINQMEQQILDLTLEDPKSVHSAEQRTQKTVCFVENVDVNYQKKRKNKKRISVQIAVVR